VKRGTAARILLVDAGPLPDKVIHYLLLILLRRVVQGNRADVLAAFRLRLHVDLCSCLHQCLYAPGGTQNITPVPWQLALDPHQMQHPARARLGRAGKAGDCMRSKDANTH